MSLTAYLGGTAVGVQRIRMRAAGDNGIPGLSQNANGESAQGGIIFEDPDETMTVTGWMPIVVEESLCVGHERIFTGYVADRTYGRGAHYRADSERQIDTTLNDTMVLLQTDVFLFADNPTRPAETDTARMTWLLGTPPMSGRIFDLGLVTTGVEHYDATDFLHQTPFDVLNDLCSARGNIFFTYWDDSAGKIGLYYDTPIVTAYTSDLTFSNVPSDLVLDTDGEPAGPTYFAYLDPTMRTRPDEVYCRIIYRYKGGTILLHDQATHDYFFSTGGPGDVPEVGHRTIIVENDRVGLASTATSFATRLLEHYSVERQEVNFTTRIRATDIGLIKPGMRTGIRFDHLPDLSTQQYYRVEEMTISQTEGRRDWYDAQIVASVHGLGLPPGTGGGSTDVFPPVPPDTTPSVVQTGCGFNLGGSIDIVFPNPVAAGDLIVIGISTRDGITNPQADMDPGGSHIYVDFDVIGRTQIHSLASQECVLMSRIVTADDAGFTTYTFPGSYAGSGRPKGLGWELAGVGSSNASQGYSNNSGSFSFSSLAVSGAGITVGVVAMGTDSPEPVTFTPNDNIYVEAGDHLWQTIMGIDQIRSSSGSQVYSGTFTTSGGDSTNSGTVAFFPSASATSTPPRTGQVWGPTLPNETPDGSTTVFTLPTGWTWGAGTLRVYVDRLDQTAAVVSEDGAAGTFTLGFAPQVGELVEVYGTGL